MYSNTPENLRPGFTDEDDNEMWRFLLKKLNEPDYGPARSPNGLVLWRDFIKEEPGSRLAQKTESNLASHFRKAMRGRIMDSNLTNDEIRFIFNTLHWNMGAKEEAILKDRSSPVLVKPRIFVGGRSPRKRCILVSTIETSGFVDSDVEQSTPRKRAKRQLVYGKLDNDVFMRPGTRFDDEESIDFLFNDSSRKEKKKDVGEENITPTEEKNEENDGGSSDASSYDSLEYLGSKSASSRRLFRPDSNVSETSETSGEKTPVRRRSKRIQGRSEKNRDTDVNMMLLDSNIIVETVALQNDDFEESEQEQEVVEIKKEQSTNKSTDVNENGVLDQEVREINLDETSMEEGTNNRRSKVNDEKNKVSGALERRPPMVDLSTPVIEIDEDKNSEEIIIEDESHQGNETPVALDNSPDADIQVLENPVNPTAGTADHPDTEIQVLETNANTETEDHEFAPVTISCMKVAFHCANGDDVVPDDDTLAAAMKLEISKSLDHYLRNLVQHFKNDHYANERNANTVEPASSVDSLPYYT